MRSTLKCLLSIPVTGAMLALAACSDGPTTSTGGVTLERSGAYTVNLEVISGTGAVEIYAGSSAEDISPVRTAVAQGECPQQGTCRASHTFENSEAKYLKIVYTAKNVGTKQFYMNKAYHCTNSSKGCTSGRIDNMGKINTALTGVALVLDTVAIGGNSLTIGMSAGEDKPTGAGIAGATAARCWDASGGTGALWVAGEAIYPAAVPACALALPAGSPVTEDCTYLDSPYGMGDLCVSECSGAHLFGGSIYDECLNAGLISASTPMISVAP